MFKITQKIEEAEKLVQRLKLPYDGDNAEALIAQDLSTLEQYLDNIHPKKEDAVNPKHYTEMEISPLEYIKANNLEWNVANVIKYVSRYKSKNGLEDLKKARWYLDDLIKDIENDNGVNLFSGLDD